MYYPKRDYEKVLSVAENEVERAVLVQLKKFLSEGKRDLKREDAVVTLKMKKPEIGAIVTYHGMVRDADGEIKGMEITVSDDAENEIERWGSF